MSIQHGIEHDTVRNLKELPKSHWVFIGVFYLCSIIPRKKWEQLDAAPIFSMFGFLSTTDTAP